MGAVHWLRLPHPATSIGWIALSFYFAFYVPVFVGLSRVAVHRLRIPVILACPIIWTGLELARAHLLTGMTMASLGHTQYRWIETDPTERPDRGLWRELYGDVRRRVHCARHAPRRRASVGRLAAAAGRALLAARALYGHERMGGDSGKAGPRIALIQGSIDIEIRRATLLPLGSESLGSIVASRRRRWNEITRIELIVWPESMFPWVDFTLTRGPGAQESRVVHE